MNVIRRTISIMIGKGSVNHNSRKFNAKNTDPERSGLNIEYCNEPIKQVYHKLFDDALEKYNSKQTCSDRRIENYYEKIRTGKQEKPFHEIIIQIGDMNNMNCLTENGEIAKNILDEYFSQFQNRNKSLYVFSAHLHLDESTPHLHIDFVPYTTDSKRGLETRVSLKQALANQGFTGKGKHETEWNQWVLSEKKTVAEIMQKYGIEWEQRDTHEEHLSDYDYKKKMRMQEVEKLNKTIEVKQNTVDILEKEIVHLTEGEEEIKSISINLDEEEEYQLPEPPPLMSAKTYKTKYVEPVFRKLKSLAKEAIARYVTAKANLERWKTANRKLSGENQRLYERIERLEDDISFYKKSLKDYALLRKTIGGRKTDEILEQAKSGTNFNRPGFQELLNDIDMGYISVVMVKDLSRLGRDYVSVGHYTDHYFPDHNIRFIAVNDMVDSDEGDNEIAPFKNIMNEFYARDISKKVRSSNRIRGNLGEPLSQPPYGYVKDPTDKKHWVIDPEASQVVKRIFLMAMEGKGNETIARLLQEDKILNPTAYWQSKGIGRGGKKTQPNPCKWGKTTVTKILSKQEYCGDIINFKTYSKSFKNKKRYDNAEENMRVFLNVNDPIIDRDVFETVQSMIKRTKRRAPKPENAQKSIFSGLMRCGDCGHNLRYHTNTVNKDIHYFSCGNYTKDTRGDCPTRHYIREDAVYQIVTMELQKLSFYLQTNEDALVAILEEKTNKDVIKERKYLEGELQKSIARQQRVSQLYTKLYEDNSDGKVSDEWFMEMSHKYEVERVDLKANIATLRTKLSSLEQSTKSRNAFVSAIRKFMSMETLTAPLLQELIDHIDVYDVEGTGKDRTQRVVIFYRFVGYIEIPEDAFGRFQANTRQGVAIEYIPKALNASA